MRIEFEGKKYSFVDTLTVGEAMVLHDKAHIGINELLSELVRGNPYVVATLVFILKRREKEAVRWDDLLSANALKIRLLGDEDEESSADAADDSAADPTPTSSRTGRSRKTGTTRT